MSLEKTIEDLKWRYATKVFDANKKVPDAVFEKILDAAVLSPSSFGLQPWRFFVVKDAATRAKLKEHAWNQSQITDASHLIVLANKANMDADYVGQFIERTAKERGVPASSLESYKQMMLGFVANMQGDAGQDWMSKQVYIPLGILMTACASERIDACPMEGFDAKKFDEVLGLADKGYHSRVLLAVGYRSEQDKYASAKKIRFNKSEVVETI